MQPGVICETSWGFVEPAETLWSLLGPVWNLLGLHASFLAYLKGCLWHLQGCSWKALRKAVERQTLEQNFENLKEQNEFQGFIA